MIDIGLVQQQAAISFLSTGTPNSTASSVGSWSSLGLSASHHIASITAQTDNAWAYDEDDDWYNNSYLLEYADDY